MIGTRPYLATARGERPELPYLGVSARRGRDSSLWQQVRLDGVYLPSPIRHEADEPFSRSRLASQLRTASHASSAEVVLST